jgi:hypothetical protein
MNILKSRKAFLLLTMLLTGGMASAQVVIKGTVYGGGEGIHSDQQTGLVTGNTKVILNGGIVERSLYGGGELGSVGTFTEFYDVATGAHVAGEPKTCATGTGKTEVLIRGGQVGKNETLMPEPGATTYEDDLGYVFCGSRGESDSLTYPLANLFAVVKETHLKISGSALVTASVYGGCENGLVLGDTHVEIAGGQIGTGYDRNTQVHDGLYSEEQWTTVIQKIKDGSFTETDAGAFHECDHWPYGDGNGHYYTYDIYAEDYDSQGGALNATDGHTFYGNVFGGGSGYYPFWDEANTKAVWRRSAGRVWGNTVVNITGGHILTNVYGGNEQTDVMGNSTVNMTGGTLGVPRSFQGIKDHPVTCYLFGGGKGDQRVMFNTWTNVENAEVNISDDAFIFGSAFGGGEDGHVLSNVAMNIEPGAHIGTYGYSYVDGNVFGGGRGFSGDALTAGSVGGNVTLNISGGTMLGSVYGGGRLASVGTPFVNVGNPLYGQMQADDYSDPAHPVTHGHVTVNISGGVIGNDYESKLHLGNPVLAEGRSYGGNVYGGSMGRLTKIDGTTVNPMWPNLGKVKNTSVTISGDNTIIKGSVFGGSELGTLSSNETDVNAGKPSGNATVTINGGTIWRNVYGGSYGSDNTTMLAPLDVHNQYSDETVQVTPMQRAGRIEGNTKVVMNGGWVKKCIYGGGSLASVGTLTEWPTIHDDETQGFALSWPYEFKYAEGTGYDTVIINNGRVGMTGKDYMGPWNANGQPIYYDEDNVSHVYDLTDADQVALLKAAREDNGDVYGGGKGIAGDRYVMAHCANSNNTEVIINYPNNIVTPENYKPTYSGSIDYETAFYSIWSEWTGFGSLGCLPGAVYGGGENGHVNENARVTLEKGLVGHNIYGGGKGTDTYPVTLEHYNDHPNGDWHIGELYEAQITSLTAGKVYGNTYVTVNDGYVVRNVFGGGNRASVGKGNYAGGPGDYQVNGYGEKWTTAEMRELLMNSGHTYVNVYGGQIGTANGDKDDLPTGNVFGSSRGEPAPNVPSTLSPRYHYCPEFFSGYVNHTHVTIGENPNATPDGNSPRLFGSVYGGGQDGHVRWGTEVVVNDAEIGNEYVNPTAAEDLVGTSDTLHFQWLARGNVYGAGSGTGTFTDVYGVNQHSNSSGSVTHFTSVTINGGLIHRNVYGGGSLASVGPPRIPPLTYDANRNQTLATVNINGTIGKLSDVNGSYIDGGVTKKFSYGGHVFGGSRGELALDESSFSTSIYTEVNVGQNNENSIPVPGYVLGNVYGGGEVGIVKQCTEVNMNAGEVGTIGYTWKRNTNHAQPYDSIYHTSGGDVFGGGKGHLSKVNAALVMDSTVVNINGGHVFYNVYGGGEVASVGESEAYTYTFTDANDQTTSVQDLRPVGTSGFAQVKVTGGQVGPAPGTGTYLGHPYNVNIGLNGLDGYVFGGGEGIGKDPTELYKGYTNVNYAKVEVNMPMDDGTHANRIWGSIFGGAEDGHVLGSDTVHLVSGLIGTYGTTSYDGNIFGGGRNYSKKNYTAGRTRGNITVEMEGGHLLGCLFGGGRLALTGIGYNGVTPTGTSADAYKALLDGPEHGQVSVKVTGGTVGNLDYMRDRQFVIGDVYGGGKGSKTGIADHPASSALLISLVKDTEVEISGTARIYGSVYGGGEVANVGNYTWNQTGARVSHIDIEPETGHTKVAVSGGTIGLDNMQMITESGYPDDFGHVFGGGAGWTESLETSQVVDEEGDHLVELMACVGTTEVEISDDAFVLGSVYGGGDNGSVFDSTWVKIQGGQIGAGQGYTIPYTDDDWASSALAPTAHWDYTMNGNPYDIFVIDPETGRPKAGQDGGTFFGNVFGGGSGYYPYGSVNGQSQWLRSAGHVWGNTRVEVSGGHILSCLYGGCEVTNVGRYTYNYTIHGEDHNSGGKATVVMSGGTIGVPRTTTDIQNLPVPGYLYGSGKGDPRIYFNTWTNVWETDVTVSGGRIYGCVFGGGEDAHVMGDVNLKVSQASSDVPTIIGTQGLTKADGNVFGAGRGTTEEALTAGSVSGNVNLNITGGTILNSVFGGGNRASVGTYLVDAQYDNNGVMTDNPYYGQMRDDVTGENAQTYGHVVVNVSGGTVVGNGSTHPSHVNPYTMSGNVYGGGRGVISTASESIWPLAARVKQTNVTIKGTAAIKNSVYGGGEVGSVRDSTTVNIAGNCTIGGVYTNNNVAENCGHVFGGGRGYEGADTAESLNTDNALHEPTILIAGRVYGDTYVNIKGGHVFENVFGGGEVASVGQFNIVYENTSDLSEGANSVTPDANTGTATVKVTGGIIGPLDGTGLNGYVFGGPKGGSNAHMSPYCNVNTAVVEMDMPMDGDDRVWGSLFGGGSQGHVLGDATVTMKKGTLGTNGITGFDGNIFGGGRNYHEESETAGRVGGNTTVNILGGHMLGSVFGGGRLGSVGIDVNGDTLVGVNHGYATVNVGGQYQIGNIDIGHLITDPSHPDERVGGNVYGGAKGKADAPGTMATRLSKVKQTTVNIMEKSGTETWIEGSVFGSGEDGHVLKDTYVNIHGGQIGGHDYGNLEPCNDPYHGNVYGGGRGVDTYEHEGEQIHSHTAGLVQGNTHVNMDGGHVIRNVYGGGNLASVGNATEEPDAQGNYKTGLASVTIVGGTVGTIHEDENFGNVFGSGHGGVGGEYVDLAFVKNTHVTIGQTAQIYGSAFGGGEDGHVRKNALVDIEGGIIGDADDANPTSTYYNTLDGNVYGGGRGLLTTVESETAGEVYGYTIVNIRKSTVDGTEYSPVVWNNVYGGGSQSVVHDYKVVNMSGGLIHGSLFGGSRQIPASRPNKAPRWVNMWGGTVEGNVYGCSYYAEDDNPSDPHDSKGWASFVNISGGTIGTDAKGGIEKGNVYGAGYGGKVKGSVAVLIGQKAIVETSNDSGDEFYGKNIHRQETPAVANLDIKGSVFGGSYGSIGSTEWDHSFNVSGYSRVYIDGTGYNTTISAPAQSTTNYMNIEGGIYGCGTNCESGEEGRNILVRNYGTRNPEGNSDAELTQASRTLTTLQRGDIIMLDNTNVNLSGADDISQSDSERKFAVLQVDKGVYVTNASGIVLGAVGAPAYMDSIHEVRSLHLINANSTSYGHLDGSNANDWEWIGVNPLVEEGNTQENARLYYTQTNPNSPLIYNQENVIIFNGDSRLYVRYLDGSGSTKIRKYGQLQGFFRMRGDLFQPYGTESFAYARPKVTPKNNPIAVDGYNFTSDILNGSDGGFLSYVTDYNFFTQANHEVLNYTYHYEGDDGGSEFTKTKQYPYFNIGEYVQNRADGEMDLEEFREWVLPVISGRIWYVDGRGIGNGNGGWGKDRNHQEGWGHFPDKPKLTVSGNKTITVEGNTILEQGICYDESTTPEAKYPAFDKANDIIYVVGPIEAVLENDNLNRWPDYQLKLYRYPGGHLMSNDYYDETVVDAEHPATAPDNVDTWNGQTGNSTVGPGANLGMMIHANKSNFVMENVLVDGLYGATTTDVTTHSIPTSFMSTQVYKVNKPMVVTTANSTLTLKGSKNIETGTEAILANGTILQRGYNGIDVATTWYNNVDYDCYTESTSGGQQVITVTPQGGGLFVDKDASCTVNVEGLVTITSNKQRHVVGSNDHPVNCNVYLPTFSKHFNITDELEKETHIGVTSPIRNTAEWYYDNTFSPVAEAVPAATATMEAKAIASQAWQNCNFNDDQGWFFVNENVEKLYINESVVNHKRTTYYDGRATTSIDGTETIITPNPTNPNLNENTLFFGWTWANVVRANPGENSIEEVNEGSTTTFNIKDEKGLAWLISMTSGMNGVGYSSTDFSSSSQHPKFIKQTDDINLKQYVWVPIGSPAEGNHKQFAGNYDGKGHLIKNLYIEYIGVGDSIYERHDYGLFGNTYKANVNRTFVVSGKVSPVIPTVENTVPFNPSIDAVNTFNVGGLVGYQEQGDVTNSEAAVEIICPDKNGSGIIGGGLVAKVEAGVVHSSMAMPVMGIGASSTGPMGGLVGNASNNSSIENSFVNATFNINSSNHSVLAGGLLGRANGMEMKNCYSHMRNEPTSTSVFKGIINQFVGTNDIDYCYVEQGYSFDNCGEHSDNYTYTTSPDNLGYMYYDNIIDGDTTLVARLNINAWSMNPASDSTYAHWARPGLAEINGDLPVLLLCEFDADSIYQGNFRSVGTYEGGRALQYGGPVRDDNELDSALARTLEKDEHDQDIPDYLFVYGDVKNVGSSLSITQSKVSYHEDVSILNPGKLSDFANNYVGITFDNSCGHASSSPGINEGLIGTGGYLLPRDWHMFSTPLSNAPLGFDYKGDNVANSPHYNNPWESTANEFNWLNGGQPNGNNRYWMKDYDVADGYFPTGLDESVIPQTDDLFIVNSPNTPSDECPSSGVYRYPYGMDFYTWNEPQYHWINFKRNGPNHWHSDTPHVKLDYVTEKATNHDQTPTNVNEETLISGKGYMAAITKETFMQSHGKLNTVDNDGQSITLKNTSGSMMPGWNLVGNPYHGYLDFDELAKGTNLEVLSDQNYLSDYADERAFYVVYNADKYDGEDAATAFRYYPVHGSRGGDYAERYLHPHQAFYVKAKDTKPLRFKGTMLSTRASVAKHGEESHLREDRPAYPLVNLYLSSDQGCADVTVIEFERPNWGGARKMKELRVGDGVFYAQHDDTHYAVLFAQQGIDRVPLWFEAKEDDIFNIKWNTANGDFHSMYLIDNLTGVQYDMLRNNSYTFEGHKGDYPSRFLIVFNVTDVEEHVELNSFVFFDGSQWLVTGDGELEFIDLNGQVLWEKEVHGGQTRITVPEVASGMYLFRLTNGKETKVQKVIVNR